MSRWLTALIVCLLAAGLGLAYGWLVNPVKFVDTTPASLRSDYRADYVLMVAETYQAGRDPGLAARQLAVLGGPSPAAACADALRTAEAASYSQGDIELLRELARAMQSLAPTIAPAGPTP